MKNDYSFKLVAAIVIAGVFIAFFSPNSEHDNAQASTESVTTVAHAE